MSTHIIVSAACLQEDNVAARAQALLSTPRFRCYRTTDVIGVELGGALKNVLAIACGETGLRLCKDHLVVPCTEGSRTQLIAA